MRRVNIKLLAWLVGSTLVFVVGAHLLHGFQVSKNAGLLLAQAERSEKDGNLRTAAKSISQYLKHKDDPEQYIKLTSLLSKILKQKDATPGDIRSTYDAFEEALRRHPELNDVRRLAIEFYMTQLHRYHDAITHLEYLQQNSEVKDAALDAKYCICLFKLDEVSRAAKMAADLIGYDPKTQKFQKDARGKDQIEAYALLAHIYRVKQQSEKQADRIMAHLVAQNKDSAKAFLARGQYLQQYASAAEAKREFSRALELAPDDAEVILNAAVAARMTDASDEAESLLEHGLEKHDDDMRMYRLLAQLRGVKDVDGAMEVLKKGIKATTAPASLQLLEQLADFQLQKQLTDAALSSIKKLEEANYTREKVMLLKARLTYNEKKWTSAIEQLEKLRPLLAKRADWLGNSIQVNLLLADGYLRTRQFDRCQEASQRVLEIEPGDSRARYFMAMALQMLNKPDDAARQFASIGSDLEKMLPGTGRNRELIALVEQQLAKPAEERDWAAVDAEAEKIKPTLSDAQQALFEAEIATHKQDLKQSRKLLAAARKKFPKEAGVWLSSIRLSQFEKKSDEVAKLLDAAERELGSTYAIRQLRFNQLVRQNRDKLKEGLPKLEAGIEQLTKDEQTSLWDQFGQAYATAADYENARRCWQAFVAINPDDTRMLQKIFDLAHAHNSEEGMAQALDQIAKLLGSNGDLYKYGQASRITWEVLNDHKPKTALVDARKLVAEARQLRPEWNELFRLVGVMDEVEGNITGAIKNYQTAFDKGNQDANMARRLVRLLYAQGRADDIPAYLKFVGRVPAGDPIEKIAAEASFTKNPEAAIKRAKRTAEKADDAPTYLWLGNMLTRAGESDDAQAAYQKAIEKDPQKPEAWLMLVAQLMSDRQRAKAEEEIRKAEEALGRDAAALTLAQLHELINDQPAADEHYQAALKQQPENVNALRSYANFLARTNHKEEAIAHLDRILAVKAEDATAAKSSARRAKAKLVAERGNFVNMQQALAIIDENAIDGKLGADDLVQKSQLLATRPETALRGQAIQLYEQLQQLRDLSATEQLTLAALLEQNGQWKKARTQMEGLLARVGEEKLYLAAYVKMLLEHDELIDEVPHLLDRLDKLDPNYEPSKELRAWVLVKQQEPEKALAILKNLEPQAPLRQEQINRLASLAAIYEELGFHAQAEAMLRKYVAEEPRAILVLATFVGRREDVDEAFALYEQARAAQPVDRIIQAALGTLRQRQEDVGATHFGRVEDWLNEAIEAEEDVETRFRLRLQQADLRDLQGRYPEVVKIYRDFLENSNADALQKAIFKNNLSFLVSMDPKLAKAPDEALKLANEAIDVLGLTSDLLDTRAMAYYGEGNFAKAISEATKAIDDAPSGNKYLHLALFQYKSGNKAAAQQAFRLAHGMKLKPTELSKIERAAYDLLQKELGPVATVSN